MVKGTDLILAIQVLIVQHKICRDLHIVARSSNEFKRDIKLTGFFSDQFSGNNNMRSDLQNLLLNLGNSCDHINMDNLHSFIKEKHLPALSHNSFPCKVYMAIKKQYFLLVKSYTHILAFKSLPIAVESNLLFHLTELQYAAAFLRDHSIILTEPFTAQPTEKLNVAV